MVCDLSGAPPPAVLIDRPQAAIGSRHQPGMASGAGWWSPSPICAPTGDPTSITYSGKIVSLDRDAGNQDALQVAINDDRFVQEIGDIDIRLFWYSRNGDDAVSNVTNAVYVIVPPGPNFIDT